MVTQRKKHRQKWGVGLLKAQRMGWSVTTVNQPPGESRKTESDLRSDKALANAQLAHPAGPAWAGPHPSESRDMGLQGAAICPSTLSAQESAPLLARGNPRQGFPENTEQVYFNRVHLDTSFLSYFRITLGGWQIISSCLCTCLRISYQHKSNGLTGLSWQRKWLTHVLTRHLLIFSHVNCNISLGNLKFTGKIQPVSTILALLWVGIQGRLVAQKIQV